MAYRGIGRKHHVVDTDTGEVISKKKAKEIVKDELEGKTYRSNNELSEIDPNTQYEVKKTKRHKTNGLYKIADKGSVFNKMFRIDLQQIMKDKELSKNSKIIMMTLFPFLHYKTNSIKYDYKTPTFDTICDLCDLSMKTFMIALKELQEKEIVQVHKFNGQNIIYVNPYLISGGPLVESDTYEMFKDSRFNY